jgi:hypothetical protein
VKIRGYSYRHIDCLVGFTKYAVEMGSSVMLYIPSFVKIGSGIQKFIRGDRQHDDLISQFLFFQNNYLWGKRGSAVSIATAWGGRPRAEFELQ